MLRTRTFSWVGVVIYILVFLMLFVSGFPLRIRISTEHSVDAIGGFLRAIFIFPLAICELFEWKGITINQVPNDGRWYDIGYAIGILVLLVAASGVALVPRRRTMV